MESSEDRSYSAVRVWMPLAAVAAAITFAIAFVMRIHKTKPLPLLLLLQLWFLVDFYLDHLVETKENIEYKSYNNE